MLLTPGTALFWRPAGQTRIVRKDPRMAATMTCPACRAALQVGRAAIGQQVRCPRCRMLVAVPPDSAAETANTAGPVPPATVTSAPPAASLTRSCPACGRPIALSARKCRHCKTWLEAAEDEDEREFYRSQYLPCPRCGATGARRVVFTFWGSFYGPALLHHVRCPNCGYAYNGKTGRSNLVPAILFVVIPAVLIVTIVTSLVLLLLKAGAL